jgi:adenylate cyclase
MRSGAASDIAEVMPAVSAPARALVVDDILANRRLLRSHLDKQGVSVVEAESGQQALALLANEPFDVILLDVMMPEIDGVQILRRLKADPALREIPVLMVSAVHDMAVIVACLELGADDYLQKPVVPAVLRARVSACVERSRLRSERLTTLQKLSAARDRSEALLLNVLPRHVAERLKDGQKVIADSFPEVTILFADIVGFTSIAAQLPPPELLRLLDSVFSGFDELAEAHGLEKIKTAGDAWMIGGGVPDWRPDHASAIAELALGMPAVVQRCAEEWGRALEIRIGISTGPAIAGVIGHKKFIYDVWGDAVNVASRMEANGEPGRIHVSAPTRDRLANQYDFEARGLMSIKGKGPMSTYFLIGRRSGR